MYGFFTLHIPSGTITSLLSVRDMISTKHTINIGFIVVSPAYRHYQLQQYSILVEDRHLVGIEGGRDSMCQNDCCCGLNHSCVAGECVDLGGERSREKMNLMIQTGFGNTNVVLFGAQSMCEICVIFSDCFTLFRLNVIRSFWYSDGK